MNHWMDLKEILQESLMVHGTIDGFLKIFMGVPLNQSVDVWHFFAFKNPMDQRIALKPRPLKASVVRDYVHFGHPRWLLTSEPMK
jgi:hypothetical protein